jgi:hypothetical protein
MANCGVGGFLLGIRIVQSVVTNWNWNKSTFVYKFFSPVLILFCIVQYCPAFCHSNTVWNMAKKYYLDLETWSTSTNLHKEPPRGEHSGWIYNVKLRKKINQGGNILNWAAKFAKLGCQMAEKSGKESATLPALTEHDTAVSISF